MEKRNASFIVIPPPYFKRMNEGLVCPFCEKPKTEWIRRKDWRCCSVKCTEGLNEEITYGWQDLRLKVFKRDNYCCVKCKFRGHAPYSDLIGDHIIPIALGGYESDIDNVQTLCNDCNKIKTKKDIKNITKQRRINKIQEKNKTISQKE